MKNNNNPTPQWKKRVIAFQFIYSCLITNLSKQEIIEKFNDEIKPLNDTYIDLIVNYFIENKDDLENKVKQYIKTNWTIERINVVDLSIVYCALCEQKAHNVDFGIIIDQAVVTAKKYSEESSYRFVNSILDKIFKEK